MSAFCRLQTAGGSGLGRRRLERNSQPERKQQPGRSLYRKGLSNLHLRFFFREEVEVFFRWYQQW